MILKMSQISALEGLREKFFSASFPLKTAYKVTRLFEAEEKEYNFYIVRLREIIDKYSQKNEDGTPKMTEDGGNVLILPEKIEDCHKELSELENLEIGFPNIQFSVGELENFGELSVLEMRALMPFLE